MINLSVAALTRAWLVAVIASLLLWLGCAVTQVWNSQVYFANLQRALQLVADGPPTAIDRWN